MRTIRLGLSNLQVPVVAVGCMRLNGVDKKEAEKFLKGALDIGANFFDHADCYDLGGCEKIFSEAIGMTPALREKMILQSKVGIDRPNGRFDFSKKHILEAVDGILSRLKTEYLDIVLLHRPDVLVEPEQVAEAFDILESNGKVRNFGVSNQQPMQIELLKKFVKQPIVCNQLQFSIMHATMVSNDLHVNMNDEKSIGRDGAILNYCRLKDITVQAWSPFQHGFFGGVFLDNPQFPELNAAIDKIAKKYGASNTTVAAAWILRHPAKMQVVTGTMKLERLKDCVKASEVDITGEEWYEIYLAAGNDLP
jgi:predicted oxidoreductase